MEGHYYHHDNHLKRHKYVKRARWFGWGALVSIILLVIALVIYFFFIVTPETPTATSVAQTKIVTAGVSVFRTPYYQFQTSDNWIEVENSDQNKFEYRSEQGALVQQDLTVFVNPSQRQINGLKAKHVLVVDVENDALSTEDDISEPCGNSSSEVEDNDEIAFNETTFKCIVGGALFDVLVSVRGGGPVIEYAKKLGETTRIAIYYRDLRSTPDGAELQSIIRSFQLRPV